MWSEYSIPMTSVIYSHMGIRPNQKVFPRTFQLPQKNLLQGVKLEECEFRPLFAILPNTEEEKRDKWGHLDNIIAKWPHIPEVAIQLVFSVQSANMCPLPTS